MSTNYYVKPEVCKCCGRSDEPIHIGESSCGWTFSFHTLKTVRSFSDWKIYLEGKTIVDEYGAVTSLAGFVAMVERKKGEDRNYALFCGCENDTFLDDEGNSFSDYEFN